MSADAFVTIPEFARSRGLPDWLPRRVWDALRPQARRVGRFRVLDAADVAELEEELRRRGHLAPGTAAADGP